MDNKMKDAIARFRNAALACGFYDEEKPVILEKGKTLLVKTSRARIGQSIVNNR